MPRSAALPKASLVKTGITTAKGASRKFVTRTVSTIARMSLWCQM